MTHYNGDFNTTGLHHGSSSKVQAFNVILGQTDLIKDVGYIMDPELIILLIIRGGFKKFEEKCCQFCNCHEKFAFSVHVVN